MSISSVTSKVIYVGDAATATLAYPFKVLANTDLTVSRYVTLTSVATVLTLNTDYAVTGVGVDAGGNVLLTGSYAGGMPTGSNTIIQRVLPLTQTVDYVENDPFPAATHENAIDKLCMVDQQLQEQIGRAVLADINQTSSNANYADFTSQRNAAASSATVAVAQASSASVSAVLASNSAASINFSIDTDPLLTSNSNILVASQKATKSYAATYIFNTASPTFTGTTNVTTLTATLISTSSLNVTLTSNFTTLIASLVTTSSLSVTGSTNFNVVQGPTIVIDNSSEWSGSHLRLTGAPANSVPTDGDIWYDGASLKIRIGSNTRVLVTA